MRKLLLAGLGLLFAVSAIAQTPVIGLSQIPQPVTSSWSTIGAGCTNSNTKTTNGGAAILVLGQASTVNMCGVQTAATGSFTHIVAMYPMPVVGGGNASVLVGFTDGTKYEACGTGYGNSANATTALQAATLAGAVSAANGQTNSSQTLVYGSPVYFRLKSVAGTSLSCDYSPDGLNWINIFTDSVPALTVSGVIFGANARSTAGVPAALLVGYL